jgi:plasmid stability protein
MPKTIQVRNVPEHVHARLKTHAALEGMTLSGFIRRELARVAERSSMREWLDHVHQAKPIPTTRTAAQVIRGLRDSR